MNSWEQASFASVEIHNNIGNISFLVPPYQRGCVWSERQKDQFVDTLKRGLPFGTILLYRDEVKNQQLPQHENRAKKDKTIYGDSSFLQKSEYCLADLEEKFTFTTEKDLAWIDEPTLDQDMFEKKYLHYIDTRFNVMMDKIKDNFKNHQL